MYIIYLLICNMVIDKPPAVYYPPCLLICADVFETECTKYSLFSYLEKMFDSKEKLHEKTYLC